MEEDIQVLKEMIECAGGYCGNCDPDIKALENAIQTIKAYKVLEEENKELKHITKNYNCRRKMDISKKTLFQNQK